jgi:long-chain acyl-CoA synthetase
LARRRGRQRLALEVRCLQPKRTRLGLALVEPFSIENGLLTQTLKQRRDRITARDAAAIDQIYAG